MIKRGRSPLDYEYGRHFPGEAGKYRQKDLEKSYMTERNIQGLSEKVFLRLEAPSEEEHVSDQMRIRQGLEEKGYRDIRFSLAALRTLYPLCREAGWEITVTLVHEEQGILITAVFLWFLSYRKTARVKSSKIRYGFQALFPFFQPF